MARSERPDRPFRHKDSWQAAVDRGWRVGGQTLGFKQEVECDAMAPARALGKVSVQEGVDAICASLDYLKVLRWTCQNMLEAFPAELRLKMLRALSDYDGYACAWIYMQRDDLTDEEDAILYAALAPLLPAMVERLQKNPRCRAKVKRHG